MVASYLSVVWGSELATGVLANAHPNTPGNPGFTGPARPALEGWLVRPYPPPPQHARWGERWQYPPPSSLWWDGTRWALPEESDAIPHIAQSQPPFQMRPTGIHHRGLYVES